MAMLKLEMDRFADAQFKVRQLISDLFYSQPGLQDCQRGI